MEGIAGEVALLRRHFPSSISWGLNAQHWMLLSLRRGYCLHPSLHLVFRGVTRLVERLFQINHVFGSLGDWFYLQGTRQHPTVLTTAAFADPVEKRLLDRVDRFVVEHPAGRDDVCRLGIASDRIRLVFPPVDLSRFRPAPVRCDQFTVLFASSPAESTWLEARGVSAILDAAALRPNMRFRLLWRPWGDSLATVRHWIDERALQNVDLVAKRVADISAEYNAAHVTLAPFTKMDRCKPAPNSLVESLACGRPVVCTHRVGLSELVDEHAAGIVCDADGPHLAETLDRVQSDWNKYSHNARALAEKHFDHNRFVDAYRNIYAELL